MVRVTDMVYSLLFGFTLEAGFALLLGITKIEKFGCLKSVFRRKCLKHRQLLINEVLTDKK
jgi:hypothetical protein